MIRRGHSENDTENDSVSESQGNGREALGSMLIPRPSDAYTAYTRKVRIEFEKTRHDDVVVVSRRIIHIGSSVGYFRR